MRKLKRAGDSIATMHLFALRRDYRVTETKWKGEQGAGRRRSTSGEALSDAPLEEVTVEWPEPVIFVLDTIVAELSPTGKDP